VTTPRIISLVPSVTETLLAWDVEPIAVTRFCEQPSRTAVGGTKDPEIDRIVELAPDLVVVCVEENRREDADELRAAGLELFVFDIDTVDDVVPQLDALAARLGMVNESLATRPRVAPSTKAFIPIWRRPWMTMHAATYGSSVLERIGIENVFGDCTERYPEVTLDAVRERQPNLVIAPSEPYPFAERHRAELATVAPVVFVDGKDLFWWGVRTPAALDRLAEQLSRAPT
jgi:ABC-type Fe3+-hydroxamate transport system substrate-binding protein